MKADLGENNLKSTGRRRRGIALFSFVLALLPAARLFAQVPPSADTFVSRATPKTNYG